MADGNGNGQSFGLRITPAMVIQLVTFAALFAGQWYTMGEKIESGAAALRDIRDEMRQTSSRLFAAERDYATLNVRFESLREVVSEMRRQSGLHSPPE